MTLNIIFVLIIMTHARGFESIKIFGGEGDLAAPYHYTQAIFRHLSSGFLKTQMCDVQCSGRGDINVCQFWFFQQEKCRKQEIFWANGPKKFFGGVNLRCRKDFACFSGKKCRICPSFQENMQDLANFLGRNVGFVGNFVARRAKIFFRGKYALQEGFCSRKGNQDQQENFKIAIQTYHPCTQ